MSSLTTRELLSQLPRAVLRSIGLSSRPIAQGGGYLPIQNDITNLPGRDTADYHGSVLPVVSAAIHLLSLTMSSLPRYVIDNTGKAMMDHPVTKLLNRDARRWPAIAIWDYLYRSALTYGIGYAWIIRPAGTRVMSTLLPCNPLLSSYRWNAERTRLIFHLHPVIGRPRYDVPASDVLLVIGDGYGGVQGLSPLWAYGVTMGVLQNSSQHLLSTLKNGMHIGGVVESDVDVGTGMGWDLPRISELRKKLVSLFAGTVKAGGVPVLPPGFKFSPIPYNAVDIELVKLLELSIEDVCRIYRVPPRLVYHFRSGVRYSNDAEQSNTEFAQYSIRPRAEFLGAMTASQLLSSEALNRDGMSIRFETCLLYTSPSPRD